MNSVTSQFSEKKKSKIVFVHYVKIHDFTGLLPPAY